MPRGGDAAGSRRGSFAAACCGCQRLFDAAVCSATATPDFSLQRGNRLSHLPLTAEFLHPFAVAKTTGQQVDGFKLHVHARPIHRRAGTKDSDLGTLSLAGVRNSLQ